MIASVYGMPSKIPPLHYGLTCEVIFFFEEIVLSCVQLRIR